MEKGNIKKGFGTLIGNAGEYYVVAELLKRKVIAALAPRNTPGFDILATRGRRTTRIRVKTKSEGYDMWQYSAKKDGSIFRDLSNQDDFTVLVNLTMDHRDMSFFILPTKIVNKWLVKDFKKWLETPGKKGQRHNPSNPKRNIPYSKYQNHLDKYLNHWEILWKKAK